MQIIRRLKAYARQIRKERPDAWMTRMARARAQSWARINGALVDGSLNEEKFARLERHMRRLSALNLPSARGDHQTMALLFCTPITLFPAVAQPSGNRCL